MDLENGAALPALEQALERVLGHYGEPYFIRRKVAVGSMPVAALAEMQVSEPKRLFGISSPGLKMGESRAGEYLLFVLEPLLTQGAAERMIALLQAAHRELHRPANGNAYTFFSVAALVGGAEPGAAKLIKRFRLPGGGGATGWVMGRLAAVSPAENKIWCNPEGRELGKLVLSRARPLPAGSSDQ